MKSTKIVFSLLCRLLVAGATRPGTKTIFLPVVSFGENNHSATIHNPWQLKNRLEFPVSLTGVLLQPDRHLG